MNCSFNNYFHSQNLVEQHFQLGKCIYNSKSTSILMICLTSAKLCQNQFFRGQKEFKMRTVWPSEAEWLNLTSLSNNKHHILRKALAFIMSLPKVYNTSLVHSSQQHISFNNLWLHSDAEHTWNWKETPRC